MDPIHHSARIGHVHLKVSDLKRSVQFYTEVLGFQVTAQIGTSAVFLSAGGYHHHIGLNTWESKGGMPASAHNTGLYHFAILMPDRQALADMVRRLNDHEWPLEGAADHGVSEAVYLKDPDNNGIEIYADRPQNKWPHDPEGRVVMYTHPLNLDELLAL
jgi:catechol 2,3-dioxygenase